MSDLSNGFTGSITGLALADMIQLKGHNRFSGSIKVTYGEDQGSIYFTDGEITDATQGALVGEAAFYQIMRWPGGSFTISDNRGGDRRISSSISYLLLEAHRILDEEGQQPAGNGKGGAARRTMSAAAARVMQVQGVRYAVLLEKDGAVVQDNSEEGAALARKSLTIADTANRLGALLGLGEIRTAAIQSRNLDLLIYDSRQHYLGVAVAAGGRLETVEAEIMERLTGRG